MPSSWAASQRSVVTQDGWGQTYKHQCGANEGAWALHQGDVGLNLSPASIKLQGDHCAGLSENEKFLAWDTSVLRPGCPRLAGMSWSLAPWSDPFPHPISNLYSGVASIPLPVPFIALARAVLSPFTACLPHWDVCSVKVETGLSLLSGVLPASNPGSEAEVTAGDC